MPRRMLPLLLLGLTLAPTPARPADAEKPAPALIIHVRSVDDLFATGVTFARQVGVQADPQRLLDTAITGQLGPKGLDGLDRKRPLALYVVLKDNPLLSDLVLAVPITGERAFLDLLDRAHVKVEKVEGGQFGLQLPGVPVPAFFRIDERYAYFAIRDGSAIAKDQVLRPSDIIPAGDKSLLAVHLYIDRIPDKLQQQGLALFDKYRGKAADETNAGLSAAQFAARKAIAAKVELKLRQLVLSGREVSLRVDDKLNVDFTVTAEPRSPLARDFAALGRTTSRFAGLQRPGAAIHVASTITLADDIRKALAPAIEENLRKSPHGDLLAKALTPTVQSGHLDLGVVLLKEASDRHATLVGGVAVKDGAVIDQALRDLVRQLPEEHRGKVHLDAKTVGTVKVHELDGDLFNSQNEKENEHRRKLFGKGPAYVAVAPDAVVFGMGPNGLGELTKALELKPAASRPFDLSVSVPDFGELVGAGDPEFQKVTKKLGMVRIRVEGGDALRVHIDGFAAAIVAFMPRAAVAP